MQSYLLIADAFGSVTERIREFFSRRGYRVEVANDGLECLAKMQHGLSDALILDADLPLGGGDGVLEWMRRDGDSAEIPVVLMTEQNASERDGHRVTHRLQRPFDVADLFHAVNRAIKPAVQVSEGIVSHLTRFAALPVATCDSSTMSSGCSGASPNICPRNL